MGLLKAFEELCTAEGSVSEMAISFGEVLFEDGHKIADSLEELACKLGELEFTDENGEEFCWEVDRLDPEFDSDPRLASIRDATDSIVNICNMAELAINEMTGKILDKTEEVLDD